MPHDHQRMAQMMQPPTHPNTIPVPTIQSVQDDVSLNSSISSRRTSTTSEALLRLQEKVEKLEVEREQQDQRIRAERDQANSTQTALLQQLLEANNRLATVYEKLATKTQPNLPTSKNPENGQTPQSKPNMDPVSIQQTQEHQSPQNAVNAALLNMLTSQKSYFDSKSDISSTLKFPKFNGSEKSDFKAWYHQVLSILSTPPWHVVFKDINTKTLAQDDDIPTELSRKLFSHLLMAMTGNAEKLMMTKKEVWGKGLLFLFTLRSAYKQKLQRADLIKKEREYAEMYMKPTETIADYGARCIDLRQQLSEHGISTSDEGLKARFIMGLGPMFTSIQQKTEDDLPSRWRTTNIESLITAASAFKDEIVAVREYNRRFSQAKKDHESTSKPSSSKPNTSNPSPKQQEPTKRHQTNQHIDKSNQPDRREKDMARQARIKQAITNGTFRPEMFLPEVRDQCCIFHNTRNHQHQTCNEINNLLMQHPRQRYYKLPPQMMRFMEWARTPNQLQPLQPAWRQVPTINNRPPPQPAPAQPYAARHTQMDPPENNLNLNESHVQDLQEATDTLQDMLDNASNSNDTNDNVNNYSCLKVCMSNNEKPQIIKNRTASRSFIIDSGAFPHMCNDATWFTEIDSSKHKGRVVTLADGKSQSNIMGEGDITINLGKGKIYTLQNVLYVPELSKSLFSVKAHIKQQGCYVHMGHDATVVAFPKFIQSIPTTPSPDTYLTFNEHIQHDKTIKPSILKTLPRHVHEIPIHIDQNKMKLYIKKLSASAIAPIRSTPGSAGLDLFASEKITILPHQRAKITTGIAMQIPSGYMGQICPRSGLALRNKVDIAAGIIDSDYRGEVFPLIVNNGDKPFQVEIGDRIAQLILQKIGLFDLTEVARLDQTIRDQGGFGSTSKGGFTSESIETKTPTKTITKTATSKLLVLDSPSTKVTVKLPWDQHMSKGHVTKHIQGYQFTNLETPTIHHILPRNTVKNLIQSKHLLIGHKHLITKPTTVNPIPPPNIRIIDTPVANAPPYQTFNIDQLRRSFGFRNINNILNEIKATSTNFKMSTIDRESIVDIGETANMDKSNRNTFPLPLPTRLGDTVHMDIIFGSTTAIGGYKYSIFIVDKATRHKYLYPVKSLKTDIIPTLQKFFKDLGREPSLIRTDFDHKLMGQAVQKFLLSTKTQIQSAPPEHQHQNGLCERNWRSILRMARSWMLSSLLPSEFWWFALNRATQVANYIPLKINGKITTPHELAYKQKVDLRNLFPLFCVAYPNIKTNHTFNAQSVRAILVGKSTKTNCYEFYQPSTKSIITTPTYRLDESIPAGPAFNLPYDGGMYFNKYCESNAHIRPPAFPPESTVYVKIKDTYTQAEVIAVPNMKSDVYTLQFQDGSIHQMQEKMLLPYNPNHNSKTHDIRISTTPKWLHHNAKCTLFLHRMPKPQHGTLLNNDHKWQFRPGNKHNNNPIDLPHLDHSINQLISTFQIFKGHQKFIKVTQARSSYTLGNYIARHVSARGLTSSDVPTLLQHKNLNTNDKKIWDDAYAEELNGLKDLPAWIAITNAEYQQRKSEYKSILPTMAISTIKHDEFGVPKRAKYRIVALGNLDQNEWSKSQCYAPVMSLVELRLLTALAVKNNCTLKSGDVKQAFCQAILPPNEKYVLRPPPGCPISKPDELWLLKRTLYGLRRSPRHWYDKAKSLLEKVGLIKCPNAPCMFHGEIVPGKPPLYLGLYVDDFIYFSTDPEVEREFETKLGKLTTVDFMGEVTHFLGIRFQWRQNHHSTKVHLSQEAFADQLITQAGLNKLSAKANITPYRSGFPVDAIPNIYTSCPKLRQELETEYRSYVGSLLWLSQSTRPDLATITNMLARYQHKVTPKHIQAAKYAIKYVKGSKSRGITFDSTSQENMESYLHFPIHSSHIQGICDANWGPQDQSIPLTKERIPLFKSRSISGHLITLHGPIHWSSKRQSITARSTAESEIYAADECVKDIIRIKHIIEDLGLQSKLVQKKTKIYNDNMACVHWSSSLTTRGLRHMQVRENAIRENRTIEVKHIPGKINPADIFSKEDKDPNHFTSLRNSLAPLPYEKNRSPNSDITKN